MLLFWNIRVSQCFVQKCCLVYPYWEYNVAATMFILVYPGLELKINILFHFTLLIFSIVSGALMFYAVARTAWERPRLAYATRSSATSSFSHISTRSSTRVPVFPRASRSLYFKAPGTRLSDIYVSYLIAGDVCL